jgi:hypothetical protein
MNPKIEKWIRTYAWKGMIIANNINKKMGVDLGEKKLTKWLDTYIKFLNITFKIITGMTISGTFLWFLPIYLKLGWERTGVIVLVVIFLQLRYGQTKVKFAE